MSLAEAAIERPRFFLAVFLAFTFGLALGLPRLELRTDGAAIHPTGNRVVEQSEEDRRRFRDPEPVILVVSSRPGGPAIASPAGFRFLERLHRSADSRPAGRLLGGARSLAGLLAPPDDPDVPSQRLYLDQIPEEDSAFAALVDRVRRHPLVDGLFLSADGQAAAMYFPVLSGYRQEIVAGLEDWLAAQDRETFDLRLTGPLVAEVTLGRQVLWDLAWLAPLMMVLIGVLLWLCLGTLAGVLIPMVEILVVLTWTLAAMAWCRVPVTLVTSILPVVLMAIAVADEIHLLERLGARLERVGEGGDVVGREPREVLREAVRGALGELGRPIVLTSLTTAAGFLSFLTSSMAPMRHFGLFTALGILIAMAMTFSAIPALIAILPPSFFERRVGFSARARHAAVLVPDRVFAQHPRRGFTIGCICVVLCLPGVFRLKVQDSWIDNFDPRSELVSGEAAFNSHFWGSYRFDVVLTSPEEGFFERSQGFRLIEEVSRRAARGPRVGGVVSHLTAYRELADLEGRPGVISSWSPPVLAGLVSKMGALRDRFGLVHFLSDDGRTARVRLFVNGPRYRESLDLQDYLRTELDPVAAAHRVELRFSGDLPVAIATVGALVLNQMRSILWTLSVVGALLWLAFRGSGIGLCLLAPVAAATLMIFAGMGWAGLPLGIATSMFAALTLGVGVDFAVHFAYGYLRERGAGRDPRAAVTAALATSGAAIRWTAAVLLSGFLALTLSALRPNHDLGILLAAAIAACYVSTLVLLPWLLVRYESRASAPPSDDAPAAHHPGQ